MICNFELFFTVSVFLRGPGDWPGLTGEPGGRKKSQFSERDLSPSLPRVFGAIA